MAPPESSHHHLLESGLLEVSKAPSAAVAAEEEEKKEAAAWTPSSSSSMTGRKIKSEASPLLRRLLGGPAAQLQEVLLGTKLYPLFSAVPLAVAAESLRLGRVWVFAFSLIGLAPLAERVSFLSEHIANTVGPTAGGLMNATCGNVPELIIALFALHKNKMEILKWSLLGSILSNLLLVLGSSLLFGGIVNIGKERPLDKRQADVSIGLLLLGVLCHIATLVSKYTSSTGDSINSSSVMQLSRSCAIVMLIAYFGSLMFQLKTHRQIFELEEENRVQLSQTKSRTYQTYTKKTEVLNEPPRIKQQLQGHKPSRATAGGRRAARRRRRICASAPPPPVRCAALDPPVPACLEPCAHAAGAPPRRHYPGCRDSSSSEDDATDKSVIGFASAMVWLIGMAVVTAMLSSYVVTTIEEASESMGIPVRFISIILLPIVGNAAEHAGAIIFAFKNKIDISLGITLGSATQISMLVVPVILIVSWVNAIPMDLDFNLLETGSLAMAVITTAFTLQDDKWHYLKGLNLVFSYIVIAVCFFVMKALPNLGNGLEARCQRKYRKLGIMAWINEEAVSKPSDQVKVQTYHEGLSELIRSVFAACNPNRPITHTPSGQTPLPLLS
uniref:Sodium/calcium exchanger membrane region domain-containing protein n=1 Tax=Oryza nivara TaxID=4536 RepID=A0A0E0G5I8_ORYNI